MIKINISAITDVGKERTNNEDAIAVCSNLGTCNWDALKTSQYVELGESGAVTIIADGMGGANAGEIASSIAVKTIIDCFKNNNLKNIISEETSVYAFLKLTIDKANDAIVNYTATNPDSVGLGTTIVISWIVQEIVYVAWCGDSRCYSFNPMNCELKLLTKDHSYVQELIDKGEITIDEAIQHPDSNIITRCLGDVDTVCLPDVITYKITPGEILLVCSDGLCGYCNDWAIKKVMFNNFECLDVCCSKLLQLALDAGGYDNITISLMATIPGSLDSPRISIPVKIKRFLKRML
jgi:serine/threonine protein phosphatase PrpC